MFLGELSQIRSVNVVAIVEHSRIWGILFVTGSTVLYSQ